MKCSVTFPREIFSEVSIKAFEEFNKNKSKTLKYNHLNITLEGDDGKPSRVREAFTELFSGDKTRISSSVKTILDSLVIYNGDSSKEEAIKRNDLHNKMKMLGNMSSSLLNDFMSILSHDADGKKVITNTDELIHITLGMNQIFDQLSTENDLIKKANIKDEEILSKIKGTTSVDRLAIQIGKKIVQSGSKVNGVNFDQARVFTDLELAQFGKKILLKIKDLGLINIQSNGTYIVAGVTDEKNMPISMGSKEKVITGPTISLVPNRFNNFNKVDSIEVNNDALSDMDKIFTPDVSNTGSELDDRGKMVAHNLSRLLAELDLILSPHKEGQVLSEPRDYINYAEQNTLLTELMKNVQIGLQQSGFSVNSSAKPLFNKFHELYTTSDSANSFKTKLRNEFGPDFGNFINNVVGLMDTDMSDDIERQSKVGREVTAFNHLLQMMASYTPDKHDEFYMTYFSAGPTRLFLKQTEVQFQADNKMARPLLQSSVPAEYSEDSEKNEFISRVADEFGLSTNALTGIADENNDKFSSTADFEKALSIFNTAQNSNERTKSKLIINLLKQLSNGDLKLGMNPKFGPFHKLAALSVAREIRQGLDSTIVSKHLTESDASASGVIIKLLMNSNNKEAQNILKKMGIGMDAKSDEFYELVKSSEFFKDAYDPVIKDILSEEQKIEDDIDDIIINSQEFKKFIKKDEAKDLDKSNQIISFKKAGIPKLLQQSINTIKESTSNVNLDRLRALSAEASPDGGKTRMSFRDMLKMVIMKFSYHQSAENNAKAFGEEIALSVIQGGKNAKGVNKSLELFADKDSKFTVFDETKEHMTLSEQQEALELLSSQISEKLGKYLVETVLDRVYANLFKESESITKTLTSALSLAPRIVANKDKGTFVAEDSVVILPAVVAVENAMKFGLNDDLTTKFDLSKRGFMLGLDKSGETLVSDPRNKANKVMMTLRKYNEVSGYVIPVHMQDAAILMLTLDQFQKHILEKYGSNSEMYTKSKKLKSRAVEILKANPTAPIHDAVMMLSKNQSELEEMYEQNVMNVLYNYDVNVALASEYLYKTSHGENDFIIPANVQEAIDKAKDHFRERREYLKQFYNEETGKWVGMPYTFATDINNDHINESYANRNESLEKAEEIASIEQIIPAKTEDKGKEKKKYNPADTFNKIDYNGDLESELYDALSGISDDKTNAKDFMFALDKINNGEPIFVSSIIYDTENDIAPRNVKEHDVTSARFVTYKILRNDESKETEIHDIDNGVIEYKDSVPRGRFQKEISEYLSSVGETHFLLGNYDLNLISSFDGQRMEQKNIRRRIDVGFATSIYKENGFRHIPSFDIEIDEIENADPDERNALLLAYELDEVNNILENKSFNDPVINYRIKQDIEEDISEKNTEVDEDEKSSQKDASDNGDTKNYEKDSKLNDEEQEIFFEQLGFNDKTTGNQKNTISQDINNVISNIDKSKLDKDHIEMLGNAKQFISDNSDIDFTVSGDSRYTNENGKEKITVDNSDYMSDVDFIEELSHEIDHAKTWQYILDNGNSNEVKYLKMSIDWIANLSSNIDDINYFDLKNRLDYVSRTLNEKGKDAAVAELVAILNSEKNVAKQFSKYVASRNKPTMASRFKKIIAKIKAAILGQDTSISAFDKEINTDDIFKSINKVVEDGETTRNQRVAATKSETKTSLGSGKSQRDTVLNTMEFTAPQVESDKQDQITKFVSSGNGYVADIIESGYFDYIKPSGESIGKAIDDTLSSKFDIYKDVSDKISGIWKSDEEVKSWRDYTMNSSGIQKQLNDLHAVQLQANKESEHITDKIAHDMENRLHTAGFKTDEEIRLLDKIFASSAIFGIVSNGMLKEITDGKSTVESLISSLETKLKRNGIDVSEAEATAKMYLDDAQEGITAGNIGAMNSSLSVTDIDGKLDQNYKDMEALVSLYALGNIDGSVEKITEMANSNDSAVKDIFDELILASMSLKSINNDVHSDGSNTQISFGKKEEDVSRGNLIDDFAKRQYEIMPVNEFEIDKAIDKKDGWKTLRSPVDGKPGLIYREKTEEMQEGIVNISYIKSGIFVNDKNLKRAIKSNTPLVKYPSGNGDGKFNYYMSLTSDEKKALGYYSNPVKSLLRGYAHKTMVLKTQVIRSEMINKFTKSFDGTADEINSAVEELNRNNDLPVYINVPKTLTSLSKTKTEIKNGKKPDDSDYVYSKTIRDNYKLVDKTLMSDIKGFKDSATWIRKDVAYQVQGFRNGAMFKEWHDANIAMKRIKSIIRWLKGNTIILNSKKIAFDFTASMAVASAKGASISEILDYAPEAISGVKRITGITNRQVYVAFQISSLKLYGDKISAKDKKRLVAYEKELKDLDNKLQSDVFGAALKHGFVQSLGSDILSRDKDSIQGLQVDIEDILSKFTHDKNGQLNEFNNLVKKAANFGGDAFSVNILYSKLGQLIKNFKTGEAPAEILESMSDDLKNIKSKDDMTVYLSELVAAPNSNLMRFGAAMTVYADLLPRWIIYRHNINSGMNESEAAYDALNSLPNYLVSMPKSMKSLSDFYVLAFPSFWTRSQKIIYELATKRSISFASQIGIAEILDMSGANIIGTNVVNKFENGSLFSFPTDMTPIPYVNLI